MFEKTYGKNSANRTLPEIPETWRHVVAMRNPTQMLFYQLCFSLRRPMVKTVQIGRCQGFQKLGDM